MNNDLISRSALLEKMSNEFHETDPKGEEQLGFLKCTRLTRTAPTVDAQEVRHGIWEPAWLRFECSLCHKWFKLDFDYSDTPTANMNYCPHCGARMDGEGYAAD